MKIAMSVVRGGSLYYRTVPSSGEIKVEGMDKPLEIEYTGSEVFVKTKGHWSPQVMQVQLNKPFAVESNIIFCFAENTGKTKRLYLPKTCTVRVMVPGRLVMKTVWG